MARGNGDMERWQVERRQGEVWQRIGSYHLNDLGAALDRAADEQRRHPGIETRVFRMHMEPPPPGMFDDPDDDNSKH